MKIPADVVKKADGALDMDASYTVIAEWARKEALTEAEEAVRPKPMSPGFAGGWAPTESRRAFDEAARRIRALREDD